MTQFHSLNYIPYFDHAVRTIDLSVNHVPIQIERMHINTKKHGIFPFPNIKILFYFNYFFWGGLGVGPKLGSEIGMNNCALKDDLC